MHVIGTSDRPDLPLAVVVGAGGLGMATARRMANSYRVLLADIDAAKADAEAERLRGEGCDATGIGVDITARDSVAALAGAVRDKGGFHAFVQVAGVNPVTSDFREIIRINLQGAVYVTEALRPIAGPGSVAILISSLGAHRYNPSAEMVALLRDPGAPDLPDRLADLIGPEAAKTGVGYPISKWGMNFYVRRQAASWGEAAARIVSISPGMIATPMGAAAFAVSAVKRANYEKTPLKRECTMLEIADAIEFMASPRASFISGTDLLVDGGVTSVLVDA